MRVDSVIDSKREGMVPSQDLLKAGCAKKSQYQSSFFELLAEGKNLSLALDGDGCVSGDRMILRRAISNVMSNAIRHSRREGNVHVDLKHTDNGSLAIRITNAGGTIAEEHIPRLFDRFYRADRSRQGSA